MAFGCLKSLIDLRDFRLSVKNDSQFPLAYKVNLKQHRIKHQGSVGSCTAHATSSILECYTTKKLSTNFIYGIRRKLFNSVGYGMSLRNACKIVTKYGCMDYYDCPGNTEITKVFDIAEEAFNDINKLNNAYRYKADLYVNLFKNEKYIKKFLMTYGPVLASVKWYNLNSFDNNYVINFDKNSRYDYHAIVIYGWDPDGWLCQNSWGPLWGNNGLFKLKYGDIAEAFGLIDDEELSETSDVIKPTYGKDSLDRILKFLNLIIAKIITLTGNIKEYDN